MNGVCFFKGQVYEWNRFRNIGSHTCTQLPSSYPLKVPFCIFVLIVKKSLYCYLQLEALTTLPHGHLKTKYFPFTPFQKGFGVQEGKQEVTKILSLVKNG